MSGRPPGLAHGAPVTPQLPFAALAPASMQRSLAPLVAAALTAPALAQTSLPVGRQELTTSAVLDQTRSSVLLDTSAGTAFRGLGGGTGQLGDLFVAPGQEVILSTGPTPTRFGPELQTGPVDQNGDPVAPDSPAIAAYHVRTLVIDPGSYPADWATNGIEGDGPGPSVIEVTDGVFPFARLDVAAGGTLTLLGDDSARVLARGDARIDGLVRVDGGAAAPNHHALGEFDQIQSGSPVPGPDLNGNGVADGFGGFGARGGPGNAGTQGVTPFPGPTPFDFGGLIGNTFCESSQFAAPGSGGAFSAGGTLSVYSLPISLTVFGTPSSTCSPPRAGPRPAPTPAASASPPAA